MAIAYIGLGSNLQNPAEQIRLALAALGNLPHSQVRAVSSLYRTEPLECAAPQPDFINAVAAVETSLTVSTFFSQLQILETQLGRERNGVKNQPRLIDLDLLLFDQIQTNTSELILPHPRLKKRNFVLIPLLEIAPTVQLPGVESLEGLIQELRLQQTVVRIG
ncbi:MAG: 2-amino-4-hydroxy-6-hydroxymethyldihydropteridine diphosphokinase [Gammaproteobacteria bacterium]